MIHKPIIRFFSSDEMVLMYASRHVVVMLLSQWFYAIFNCIISIVNGTGKVRYTTIVNILMLWAVRIPSAYIINRYFDGTWVMLCFPISFSFKRLECYIDTEYHLLGSWISTIIETTRSTTVHGSSLRVGTRIVGDGEEIIQ
jgi:Na+-driven multidrug efflux pump